MNALFIGVAGFLGAISRYFLYLVIPTEKFPLATVVINLSGCFVAGFLYAIASKTSPESRIYFSLILIGFIGSFTTFSTFGAETLQLIENNEFPFAAINITCNVMGGIGMIWMGKFLASHF